MSVSGNWDSCGIDDLDFEAFYRADMRGRSAGTDEIVPTLRVDGAEGGQRIGVECVGIPFALDGIDGVTVAGDDEIDFATAFVTPVERWRVGQAGLDRFENHMIPEIAEVVGAEGIPTPHERHEAGVESIDLGLLDELRAGTAVEGPHAGGGMGGLEGAQMAFHSGPGDAEFRGGFGDIELAAALPQHIFEEGSEAVDIAKTEKSLDVAGEKGVHPLAIECRAFRFGQKRLGQSAVKQPTLECGFESGQFLQKDGQEVDGALATGKGVAEFFPSGERRGSGGEDFDFWKHIRAYFQEPGGVAELVDFIKDHDPRAAVLKEQHRIAHHALNGGDIAIHEERFSLPEGLREGGFAGAADATEPNNRRLSPRGFYAVGPERTINHATILCK